MGGWWRWALLSPDGVAPSWMVGVSASVNLPLHHKVQRFSSGTCSPRWSRKKGCKTVVVCGVVHALGLGIVRLGSTVSVIFVFTDRISTEQTASISFARYYRM